MEVRIAPTVLRDHVEVVGLLARKRLCDDALVDDGAAGHVALLARRHGPIVGEGSEAGACALLHDEVDELGRVALAAFLDTRLADTPDLFPAPCHTGAQATDHSAHGFRRARSAGSGQSAGLEPLDGYSFPNWLLATPSRKKTMRWGGVPFFSLNLRRHTRTFCLRSTSSWRGGFALTTE